MLPQAETTPRIKPATTKTALVVMNAYDNSAIVCCLNESFDATGVCKQLSLVYTRLRAVEFRVPVVRSSLGGTSGVFDGNGNIVAPSEVRTNFSTYRVPGDTRVSFYMRFGDWFPKLCCVITGFFVEFSGWV